MIKQVIDENGLISKWCLIQSAARIYKILFVSVLIGGDEVVKSKNVFVDFCEFYKN